MSGRDWVGPFVATTRDRGFIPRGAYFPFGAGTRKCLGDQFALLEARIILLHAAARCHLMPADSLHPIPRAEPRATYRAKGPVPMVVT